MAISPQFAIVKSWRYFTNSHPMLAYYPTAEGTISLKLLGGKLAPNLVYLVLRKELLKS